MKPLLVKYKDFIILLNKLRRRDQKNNLISAVNKDHLNCLGEIFRNFLNKNLTTEKKVIRRLKKYRDDIRRVSLKSTKVGEKKKILTSTRGGNILAVLIPLAVNILSSLLGNNERVLSSTTSDSREIFAKNGK